MDHSRAHALDSGPSRPRARRRYLLFEQTSAEEHASAAGGAPRRGDRHAARSTEARLGSMPAARQLRTPEFEARLTNRNAAVTRFVSSTTRSASRTRTAERRLDRARGVPAAASISGVNIPADATWRVEQVSPTEARFSWEGEWLPRDAHAFARSAATTRSVDVRVENLARGASGARRDTPPLRAALAEGGGFLGRQSPAISHGICETDDDEVRELRDKLARGHRTRAEGPLRGLENTTSPRRSRRTTVAPIAACPHALDLPPPARPRTDALRREARTPDVRSPPGAKRRSARRVRRPEGSRRADGRRPRPPRGRQPRHVRIIARALIALLRFIYGYVGNWGLAIILLTFLVKLVLYPLTERAASSRWRRCGSSSRRWTAINELYADDREKKGAAIMELYRKHGINPLAGCLPEPPADADLVRALHVALDEHRALPRAVRRSGAGPLGARSVLRAAADRSAR